MTLILLDGKNALFRFGFANKRLYTSDGKPTGAIHGILMTLIRLKRKYPDAQFVMVWDGENGPAWRKIICPEYKANRSKENPSKEVVAIFAQIDPLKEILAALGVPNLEIAEMEADDLISIWGHYGKKQGWDVVIYSGDHDFWQLLPFGITVLTKMINGDGLHAVTPGNVWHKFKCSPEELVKVRAIAGDSSDYIAPAVHLIGVAKGAKLVKLGADPTKKRFEEHSPMIFDQISKLREAWPKICANYKIMKLPASHTLARYTPLQSKAMEVELAALQHLGQQKPVYREVLGLLAKLELQEAIKERHLLVRLQK
jgi:5'-3' exonuclease